MQKLVNLQTNNNGGIKMQKIMFNDNFHLTQTVLDGSKTMTRRIVDPKHKYESFRIWQPQLQMEYGIYGSENEGWNLIKPLYNKEEIVAIAQSYKDCKIDFIPVRYKVIIGKAKKGGKWGNPKAMMGWSNKMLVRADLMPHHIQITNIRIEKLQDISHNDCLREGVLNFIQEWSYDRSVHYRKKLDYQYWVNDSINCYDQSISFCRRCSDKEVIRLRKQTKREHPDMDVDEIERSIYRDGGCYFSQEQEYDCHCERCGKALEYEFIGNLKEELVDADFNDDAFAYLINQFNEDDYMDNEVFIKKAYAALIDKISGEGTWNTNPYVFVYEFEKID